jgi:integrase/recombinase XerC
VNDDRIWTSYVRGLKLARRSPLTIRNYEKTARLLRSYLKEISFTDASRSDLEGFFELRLEQVRPSTVHGDYVNLRPFYNWLVAEEYMSKSPLTRIKPIQFEYKVPRVLTDAELKALFAACRGNRFYDKRDEAMLRLMSEVGGARRAEIIGMTVDDIDFAHDTVRVQGKTGERWIPFGTRTGLALDKYLRARDKNKYAELPNLWLSYRGAVPTQTVWWIVTRQAAKAGLGHVYPHTLRHTAAHRAHEAGMSPADMEVLFGWTPGSAMTRIYGRATKVVRAQNASRNLSLGDRV